MIEVEIHGRLGNHLFQYAFAYSLAREFKTSFKFRYLHKTNIDSIFLVPSFRKAIYQTNKTLSNFIDQFGDSFLNKNHQTIEVQTLKHFIPTNNTRYKGFYQSFDFFSKY